MQTIWVRLAVFATGKCAIIYFFFCSTSRLDEEMASVSKIQIIYNNIIGVKFVLALFDNDEE